MVSIPNYKHIITYWTEKGDLEDEFIDQFICYWIALNAWYGSNLLQGERAPKEWEYMIALTERLEVMNLDWSIYLSDAQNLDPKLKNVRDNRLNEERGLITVTDNLKTLIEFIYTVRNNVFHGNKSDTEERDVAVLIIAVPILKRVLDVVTGNG